MKDSFDKPLTGRSKIHEDAEGLRITLPVRKRVLPIMFICVWLCVWAVGWMFAFGFLLLLQGGIGMVQAFLFIWLVAWSAGGIWAMVYLGWLLLGREQMTVGQSGVELRRTAGPFSRRKSFATQHISHIRVVEADTSQIFNQNGYSLFSGFSKGAIRFDYGHGTLGFGLEMDADEARQLLDLIRARVPQLAN